jgi:hypothetical protein
MIGSRRCGDHCSPVLQQRLDAIQKRSALWDCPDVIVVSSHNAKKGGRP